MQIKEFSFAYIPGAAVFVLSLLSGILAGVGFFTLLLRALFFAVLFASAGFGVKVLFQHFLPELFQLAEQKEGDNPSEESDETEGGSQLNIVLDKDENESEGLYRDTPEEASFVELEEEPEEEAQADLEGGASSGESEPEVETLEEAEEVEELEAEDDSEADDGSTLSVLPDLDSLSDSFESVAESQEQDLSSGGTSGLEIDIMGTQQDTQTVAKAVRTIMKRDQEG